MTRTTARHRASPLSELRKARHFKRSRNTLTAFTKNRRLNRP